jgi:hypothetical protein
MGSRFVLSLGTAVALATAFAPRAEAQVARNPITVCRNGARINSEDSHACDRNGGIDLRASAIARHDAEARAQQQNAQTNNNGDDRYGRTNNDGRYSNDGRSNNDGRYDNDDRRGRDDHGHWDNRGGRGNGRWGNNGRSDNSPREVYRWAGRVDREVRIQLTGGRAYVQSMGNREVRNGNGQMLGGLPHEDGILRVERIEGRGDIDVIQQPTASNGYTATLRVRDPSSGAANYRIVAVWQPAYNNGRYGRN